MTMLMIEIACRPRMILWRCRQFWMASARRKPDFLRLLVPSQLSRTAKAGILPPLLHSNYYYRFENLAAARKNAGRYQASLNRRYLRLRPGTSWVCWLIWRQTPPSRSWRRWGRAFGASRKRDSTWLKKSPACSKTRSWTARYPLQQLELVQIKISKF